MPSTDTPTWWANVQQEREDLKGRGRRPADDWLGEDIDFTPRRRVARGATVAVEAPQTSGARGTDHPLHGVFVPASSQGASRTIEIELGGDEPVAAASQGTTRTIEIELGGDEPIAAASQGTTRTIEIELGGDEPIAAASQGASRMIEIDFGGEEPGAVADADAMAQELRHLHVADDPFAVPPPAAGTRRTVQITGRPGEARAAASQAQRHRPRTTSDRVGHRPDRVALWAVLLGAILILLAAASASSEAATPPAAPAAKVTHVTPAATPAFAPAAAPAS